MIQIIDNYDSFTYNLVQRLGEIDSTLDIRVDRNDEITVEEILARQPERVIISPGPCTPNEAGISVACVEKIAGKIPLLGVCLGHQSIGQAFGAKIVRADRLMHGKTDLIYHQSGHHQGGHHQGGPLFEGLDNPFQATRYHSLLIQPDTLPDELEVTAWCVDPDGQREIMAISHREYPLFGLQFHPESFLTHAGTEILRQFLLVETLA